MSSNKTSTNINSGQSRNVSSSNLGGCGAHHIYDSLCSSTLVYKSTFDSYNNNYTSQGCYSQSSYIKYAKK